MFEIRVYEWAIRFYARATDPFEERNPT